MSNREDSSLMNIINIYLNKIDELIKRNSKWEDFQGSALNKMEHKDYLKKHIKEAILLSFRDLYPILRKACKIKTK